MRKRLRETSPRVRYSEPAWVIAQITWARLRMMRRPKLVLRGFARTYHAKQLAQHAVMTETEMPILANEIEVC